MRDLPDDARLVLCDIWGVLHDGRATFPGAVSALGRWRGEGRTVVLITNAPRPASVIARQLDGLGLPADRYDALVTSGDAGLAFVVELGARCAHIGTGSDLRALAEAGFVPTADGDEPVVVCTGFDDRRVAPQDYDEELRAMRARGALLACFNPDREVIHRGVRELCAGTLADRYAAMGGEVLFTGKPFPPIYDRAFALAAERAGRRFGPGETVAIGDGIATDMVGAARNGLRFLFVAGGIEGEAIARGGLAAIMEEADRTHRLGGFAPIAVVPGLS